MSYPYIVGIGGLGGSGTRIAAKILQDLDVHIGDSLNTKLDNLFFTFLFKRAEWFDRTPEAADLAFAIDLFRRAMAVGLESGLSAEELRRIDGILDASEHANVVTGASRLVHHELVHSRPFDRQLKIGWGWKEPNTHVFLPQLAASFPNLKYIHMVRHGLDMAFSRNRQQALNWSLAIMGKTMTFDRLTPEALLDYWIAANRRAVEIGKSMGPDRFHLLNYDEMCRRPEREIRRLLDFLDLDAAADRLAGWRASIAPSTVGRHRAFDLRAFSDAQLDAVREFGFEASAA